jgi:Mrp family chromosome partitioning ATPase
VLHRRLNVSRRPGLADYLDGKAALADVVQTTGHSALDVIPSGTRLQTGPELLASRSMNELIQTLRSQYAVLVVDSPPLGAGVDPFILSTLTGSLLMVLRAGYSDRDVAEAKLEVLRRLPTRILGAVVNDAPAGAAYGYYSYYLPGYEALDEERRVALSAPPRII